MSALASGSALERASVPGTAPAKTAARMMERSGKSSGTLLAEAPARKSIKLVHPLRDERQHVGRYS